MKELSLNILDIAENSINAGASVIKISIFETDMTLFIKISDNGVGMTDEETVLSQDPFFTTRSGKSFGLGIPLFRLAAEQTGGSFKIKSRSAAFHPIYHGTAVCAKFLKNSIDMTPLGNVIATVKALISVNDTVDVVYTHEIKTEKRNLNVELDTVKLKDVLGKDIPLSSPEIVMWIGNYLAEQYKNEK